VLNSHPKLSRNSPRLEIPTPKHQEFPLGPKFPSQNFWEFPQVPNSNLKTSRIPLNSKFQPQNLRNSL
ncbi:hypothetical protein HGM15179_021936, partial [Zosterops borbonicus]